MPEEPTESEQSEEVPNEEPSGTDPQDSDTPDENFPEAGADRSGVAPDADTIDESAHHTETYEPPEPSEDGTMPIRDRIAQTLREGNPVEAGAEFTSTMFSSLREFGLPLATLLAMFIIVITFRKILLPFVLACALVYLMEPIVGFIGRRPDKPKGLPRWVAVILVYLSFILVTTGSLVFVVPTFVAEIVRFAEEVPEYVQEFRSEKLPGMNRKVQDFLRNYLPVKQPSEENLARHIGEAQITVLDARESAAARANAFANATATVGWATSVQWRMEASTAGGVEGVLLQAPPGERPEFTLEQSLTSSGWTYGPAEEPAGLLLTPTDGGTRVQLNEVALEIEEVGEKSWVVRQKPHDSVPAREDGVAIDEMFNLERRMDEVVEELVSTSNDRIASLIDFAQKLVVGVVGAFVGILLTLMVAAFISIDLPRVMGFLRSLVPRKARAGYDILLDQLDTGLAGVVRGQLLICLVNGVLTYIGLAVMQVKFSVLLAVVAGILSLIPVFGTIISTIPIVLIALTDGLMLGAGALVWILVIHGLEANFLNPKIIGSSAHIHPVIVIFALLAGESAYGLVGALLAVPTASILLTLFNFVRTKAWKQAETHEPST
jgi:predicted PurR-regulated permease PerM